ncbi:hypothetical protein EXIGLDRAFT_831601 [Exidia glandulosa HHB12029]|uniref:Uncharacterized protein n=1 Tax=Exidia glandulosa HHB12029 TaxID=1314781 RepID=A0A165MH79_EXIGL|nr:hypothetical protein EXIGLDRAFT_831601 [Exidia glandulosa HHB12029]
MEESGASNMEYTGALGLCLGPPSATVDDAPLPLPQDIVTYRPPHVVHGPAGPAAVLRSYLDIVRAVCSYTPDVYNEFRGLMRAFHAIGPEVDVTAVMERVGKLFAGTGYDVLVAGFNAFLPKGYRLTYSAPYLIIMAPDGQRTVKRLVHTQALLSYHRPSERRRLERRAAECVGRVRERAPGKFRAFLGMLRDYQTGMCTSAVTMRRVADFLRAHPDLYDEFKAIAGIPDSRDRVRRRKLANREAIDISITRMGHGKKLKTVKGRAGTPWAED